MSQHFTMTTSLLREITPHFAGTEDAAFIGLIGQVRQQAEASMQERNKKTKQLIKGEMGITHGCRTFERSTRLVCWGLGARVFVSSVHHFRIA